MKLIQLIDLDCQELGLYYIPDEMTIDEAQDFFEYCYDKAKKISEMDSLIEARDAFEAYLEEKGVIRTFAESEIMIKGF